MERNIAPPDPTPWPPPARGGEISPTGGYRWFVLAVLMSAVALSLVDRQILTILAGPIKKDLHLSDAELGLLIGTAFSVFYSLFGIPLGRLADMWVRTRLLALGLFAWSAMTIFSGLAVNLGQLAFARMGVGVGEATATPVAYSLISDYFPKRERATAIAIYSTGVSIGLGASLWVGGSIVDVWNHWYAPGAAPFGLKAWQAALIAVGLPGIVLAALVARLREPVRGSLDEVPANAGTELRASAPWVRFWVELLAIVPPFTIASLAFLRAPRRAWTFHLAAIVLLVAAAASLIALTNAITPPAKHRVLFHLMGFEITGHVIQWSALAIGIYGVFSWAQSLRLRDHPTFALIFRSPTMVALLAAAALEMTTNYALTSWAPFYAVTKYHLPLAKVGLGMGIVAASAGILGTNIGGVVADLMRRSSPRGRLYVSLIAMTAPVPFVPIMLSSPTFEGLLAWWVLVGTLVTAWLAGVASTTQDLVLPRMRGTVAAALTLSMTMIGLGLGPYAAGLISDASGSLFMGIVSVYAVVPVLIVCMLVALATVARSERTILDRARAAGEIIA